MDNEEAYQRLEKSAKEKELIKEEPSGRLENNQVMVLEMSKAEAAQVEDMNGVEVLEKDVLLSANVVLQPDTDAVNDVVDNQKPLDFNQWNLDAVNVPTMDMDVSIATGSSIKVAVMDSGVSYYDGINVVGSVDLVHATEKYKNENPLFDDPSGHGTGIAGMIAGEKKNGVLQGIDKNALLYSVKVLDEQNESPVSRIVLGIYWCGCLAFGKISKCRW